MNRPITQKPLSHLIADRLRRSIWNGDIQFGERLLESELAETFEVSRSSVREALKILEHEELVVNKARKGTYVTQFTGEDRREIVELRLLLETHAFVNALPRLNEKHIEKLEDIVRRMREGAAAQSWNALFDLDMQFHRSVVNLCGNSRIIKMYDSLQVQIRTFLVHLDQYYSSHQSFYDEHTELLDALRTKNPGIVSEAVRKHIEYVEEQMLGG